MPTTLGFALAVRKRWGEAIDAYRKAAELDPNYARASDHLAWLLASCPDGRFRDPARAVEAAQRAVELSPGAGGCWSTLGAALYRAGDWGAAVAALEQSRQLQGDNGWDFFVLAMAHWQLGETEQARARYAQAVEWTEKHQPRNEELGRLRAEAAELLERNGKK